MVLLAEWMGARVMKWLISNKQNQENDGEYR